jgi:hypothetical protein
MENENPIPGNAIDNELDNFTLDPSELRGPESSIIDSMQEQCEILAEVDKSTWRKCKICGLPLDEWQQALEYQTIHKDGPCIHCKWCSQPVGRDRIFRCLEKEEPVSHLPCHDKAMANDFAARPVTITQGHLNYLNRMIQFAFVPDMAKSLEQNCEDADLASKLSVVEMTMEQRFVKMKMLESACATLSIILDKDKEKIRLAVQKEDLARHVKIRDLNKVLSAEQLRELQEKEMAQQREKNRIKGSPELRAREKTIDSLVKLMGMSRETAIEFLDKQKNAQPAGESK